jgi:hypothetical protein
VMIPPLASLGFGAPAELSADHDQCRIPEARTLEVLD